MSMGCPQKIWSVRIDTILLMLLFIKSLGSLWFIGKDHYKQSLSMFLIEPSKNSVKSFAGILFMFSHLPTPCSTETPSPRKNITAWIKYHAISILSTRWTTKDAKVKWISDYKISWLWIYESLTNLKNIQYCSALIIDV